AGRAAVLAAVAVTRVDVHARELHRLRVAPERLAQAYDRRHAHDERDRVDLGVVLLDDVGLVEREQRDRALPRDDLDRLVALREQERAGRVDGGHGFLSPQWRELHPTFVRAERTDRGMVSAIGHRFTGSTAKYRRLRAGSWGPR